MYNSLLIIHNLLRWVVTILAILALYKNYIGWHRNQLYTSSDKKWNTFFIGSLHLQLVIGLLLYFVYSPVVQSFIAMGGAAMKDKVLRFWGVEHMFGMVLAVIIAQVGSIKAKKKTVDAAKFKTAFIYFLIAVLIIFITIPWGIWNDARPMFRLG
jgi:hypothetical protein